MFDRRRAATEEELQCILLGGPARGLTVNGPTLRVPIYTWCDEQGRGWIRYTPPGGGVSKTSLESWRRYASASSPPAPSYHCR